MTIGWDEWILDIPARTVSGPAGPVHLEPQVFDVLAYLVEHRARVVPKEELLDNIWGDQFVSESALTSRIKSVRRALGDDGRSQKYLRNVRGRGYQFVGDIDATHGPIGDPPSTVSSVDELDLAQSISVDDAFPFVGRDAEIATIEDALDRAGSRLLLIGGAPGVGKSRLAVEVVARRSRAGTIVCAGRCEEYTTSALQPIRDAVAHLAATRPSAFRSWAAGLEGQLVFLMPALVGLLNTDPSPVDGYAALEALLTVVGRASALGRLVMLIDDLHLCDEPTRGFLERLTRRGETAAVSVVCTFRTARTDMPRDVGEWIGDQSRRASSTRIDLGGLDDDAARELITAALGEAQGRREADALVARTRGHGLFLTESLRGLQRGETSSSSMQDVVSARLVRLPAEAQDLVRAGAALGAEFSFEVAAVVAGIEPASALEAIDDAVDAELLHETASPSRFRFSHQLIPEAVLSATSRAAAAVLHQRCAEALVTAGADDVDVAHHLIGAIPLVTVDHALERSREAAAQAVRANQFDRAVRLLDHVLQCGIQTRDRAEVLLQIGWAMVDAGRVPPASERFEQAAALGRRNGWDDVVVDAALGHCGRSPYRRLLDSSTLDLLAEADSLLGDEPSLAKARVLAKTAVFSQFRLPLATCDAMTKTALDMVPDAPPLERVELLQSRAIVFTCPAGVHQLEELDDELERLRSAHGIYFADAAVPETRMLFLARGDDLRAQALTDDVRIRHQPVAEWRDLTLRSTLAAFVGELDTAAHLCDEAAAIGGEFWGDSSAILHALGHALVGALGGGWERAIELFDGLLRFDQNQHIVLPAAWANLAGGRAGRGHAHAASIRPDSFRWHGEHILGGNALVAAAEVALLLDDDRLAVAAEKHLLPFRALMLGLPWACSLAASDPLARLARRRGDDVLAAEHEATARRVYASLGAPAFAARLG